MPVIVNSSSLRAGVINAIADTWRQQMPIFEELQQIMLFNLPYTSIRKAEYAWKESLPFPKKWAYGKGRAYQTFRDRYLTASLMPFELSIPYNMYDSQDDQLGDLKTHLTQSVQRFFQLADKLQSEYLNNSASLNDSISNAYDGAVLASATDGAGSNRLGVSGGNIITGSGLTADGIIHDVASAQRRFMDMRDPASQVIFSEADVEYSKLCVIGPTAANEVLQKASKAINLRTDTKSFTSETNYQMGTWEYKINPYLSDSSDLWVVVKHPYWRPFVYRQPSGEGIRSIFATFENSDRARDFNEEAICSDVRVGITPWMIASIIKINN